MMRAAGLKHFRLMLGAGLDINPCPNGGGKGKYHWGKGKSGNPCPRGKGGFPLVDLL